MSIQVYSIINYTEEKFVSVILSAYFHLTLFNVNLN